MLFTEIELNQEHNYHQNEIHLNNTKTLLKFYQEYLQIKISLLKTPALTSNIITIRRTAMNPLIKIIFTGNHRATV